MGAVATADALSRPIAKKALENKKLKPKARARNQRVADMGRVGLIPPKKKGASIMESNILPKKGSAVLTMNDKLSKPATLSVNSEGAAVRGVDISKQINDLIKKKIMTGV